MTLKQLERVMTPEDQKIICWNKGWDDYWNGIIQDNCPTWAEQYKRDAWMEGWLFAQSADNYFDELTEIQSS